MQVDSGEETRVLDRGLCTNGMSDFFWTVNEVGVYFIDDNNPLPNLKLLDPVTGRTTTVTKLDKPPFCCDPALSVSPDGHDLLYSQVDNSKKTFVDNERYSATLHGTVGQKRPTLQNWRFSCVFGLFLTY